AARVQGLPFVLCHQEWAACIMAAVTGELTGCPGAALSTLGPGVTASATGLAHAFLDRSPMIYVSDRHPGSALAFTTHQRLDHAALLAPIVKGSVTVTVDSVSQGVADAVRLALGEPRGPVRLDLPAGAVPDHVQGEGRHPRPPSARDGGLHRRRARGSRRGAGGSDHRLRCRSRRADPPPLAVHGAGPELHALPVEPPGILGGGRRR